MEFVVDREPDGKDYQTPVNERWTLGVDLKLRFSAYYGGMPTDMNHMDSVTWNAGESGKAVLDAAQRVISEPQLAADAKEVPDGASGPSGGPGSYWLHIRSGRGGSDEDGWCPWVPSLWSAGQCFPGGGRRVSQVDGSPACPQ